MPDIARLRAVVTADTKQATAALKQFSGEVDRTAQTTGKLNQANANAGRSAASFATQLQKSARTATMVGAAITAGVIVPTGLIAKSAIQAGISFESAFAGVRKTVDGTEQEFQVLRDGIRQMAREIPASADEIARVAEAAGQLGIEKDSILDFTRVMVDLGEATNLSSDQAADALARFANITQMPQSQFEQLGNVIVDLGNHSASTESEIVEMGLRIAGAGAQVGLTEGQILAFAASLSSVGINAEAGGSAFSRVMTDISKAAATGGDKLELFAEVAGMSASEFQQAFEKDAATAIIAFVDGLGRMKDEGENVFGVLDELELSEVRVQDALLRSAGAGDLMTEMLGRQAIALRENNALTNEAAQRYETTASKIQIFKNQLTDAGITIFDRLEPAIGRMLDDLTAFTQSAQFDAILDDFAADLEGVGFQLSRFIQNDLPEMAEAFGNIASAGVGTVQFMGDLVTKANELNDIMNGDGWKVLLALYAGGKIGGAPGAVAGGGLALANADAARRTDNPFGEAALTFLNTTPLGLTEWMTGKMGLDGPIDQVIALTGAVDGLSDSFVALYLPNLVQAEQEQRKFSESTMAAVDAHEQGRMAMDAENIALAEQQRAYAEAQFAARFHSEAVMESAEATRVAVDAVAELAHGLDVAHIINASWNNSVATAAQNVSHWEGMTSSAQSALDILNQRIADGIPLSEEQQEQYNLLTQGVERYKGGVEDQQDAFIKAEADRVKYTQGLDVLNQQLKDGIINHEQYEQSVAELAEGIDPAITSQANLQAATEQLYGKMEELVDVIFRIMDALGLLPEEEHIEFTAGLEPFQNALAEVEDADPEDKEVAVNAQTDGWDDGYAAVEAARLTPKTGDFGADISDWESKYNQVEGATLSPKKVTITADNSQALAAIEAVRAAAANLGGASIGVGSGNFGPTQNPGFASGGTVRQDGIYRVGEQGEELVFLPQGAEVINATDTRRMLSGGHGGGFNLTATLDIQPFLDNLHELARYIPHSPAETGPFSKEPDWDWVFSGIEDSVKASVEGAEDELAAFDEAMRDYNVWDFVLGDLDSIVTGETGRQLRENLDLLNQQLRIAIELGAPQAVIDGLNAAIAQTEQRLEDVGRVMATPIAAGMAAQLSAGEVWDSAFDNIEDIFSGDHVKGLRAAAQELNRQIAIAVELGLPAEFIAGLEAALAETQAEINAAMAISGTEAGQAWAEAVAAEQHAADVNDWWQDHIGMLDQIIADGDVERFEQRVESARRALEFAQTSGAPADVIQQLEEDLAVAENDLKVAGSMFGTAVREGWIEQIGPLTDETVAQILTMMDTLDKEATGAGLEFAESLLDEVVEGLFAGRVSLEQALEIIPRDLLDSLEEMEDALTVKLGEALLTGADNAGLLQEQLEILIGLMDALKESANNAAVAVGTFVPGRGYYYSEGTFTTAGNGSNLGSMGSNFQTFEQHKANEANVTVELDGHVLAKSTSKSFTNNHKFTTTTGAGGLL